MLRNEATTSAKRKSQPLAQVQVPAGRKRHSGATRIDNAKFRIRRRRSIGSGCRG
jgi:hypothetical protein